MHKKLTLDMVLLAVFIILIWLVFFFAPPTLANPYKIDYDLNTIAGKEVLSYIDGFHSKAPARQSNRAKGYAPFVVHWSDYYALDGLLTSVVISAESGWQVNPRCILANPKQCGRGLMQLRGVSARGLDLSDPSQQIKGGCRWLRRSIDRCNGCIIRGLMAYQTKGRCKGDIISGAKKRYRMYKKAIQQYRKTDLVS